MDCDLEMIFDPFLSSQLNAMCKLNSRAFSVSYISLIIYCIIDAANRFHKDDLCRYTYVTFF